MNAYQIGFLKAEMRAVVGTLCARARMAWCTDNTAPGPASARAFDAPAPDLSRHALTADPRRFPAN